MHVVRQDRAAQHPHTGRPACTGYRIPHILSRAHIDTPDSLPGVPRNVSIRLIGVVARHLGNTCLLTPGASPGITESGGSPPSSPYPIFAVGYGNPQGFTAGLRPRSPDSPTVEPPPPPLPGTARRRNRSPRDTPGGRARA